MLALLVSLLAGPAAAAETYTMTATTTLSVSPAPDRPDGPGGPGPDAASTGSTVTQDWTIACDAVDGSAAAALIPGGKDLRFVAAPDEALAVGVDVTPHALPQAQGRYVYDDVVGAHVFARFAARCGSAEVEDASVVDSLPLITAPAVEAPFAVRRTSDFSEVALDEIPVGVEVELVDLVVRANPRGEERVTLDIVDAAGTDLTPELSIGAADVGAAGRVVLSPRFVVGVVGVVVVEARFFGETSAALLLTAVVDDAAPDPGDPPPDGPSQKTGCSAAGLGSLAPGTLLGLLGLLGLHRRRR